MLILVNELGQIAIQDSSLSTLDDADDWIRVDPKKVARVIQQASMGSDGRPRMNIGIAPMAEEVNDGKHMLINKRMVSMVFEASDKIKEVVDDTLAGKDINQTDDNDERIIFPDSDLWPGPAGHDG